MDWKAQLLDRLATATAFGYHPGGPASSEPTALAASALMAGGRTTAATAALDWLADRQAADGSVGPTATQATPGWPTSLAVLATLEAKRQNVSSTGTHRLDVDRALAWILSLAGERAPRTPELGHDTTIAGWPWVDQTHSWTEPTAYHVLALKAAGHSDHPRTREAVRMLIDRLLPEGGCNYGNTFVFGQELRPHIQPTGLAMLALAGEADADGRISRSLDYLERELPTCAAAASLAFGLMGLAAHDRSIPDAPVWLETAYRRTIARDGALYRLALLSLAALGPDSPLIVAATVHAA